MNTRIAKILVPVDFSEPSRNALHFTIDMARPLSASIEVVHIFQLPRLTGGRLVLSRQGVNQPFADWKQKQAREQMDEFLRQMPSEVTITSRVLAGAPADDIVELAEMDGFHLVVMATRGRSAATQLLIGSVAQRVVRRSLVPVLTVRAQRPA